MSGDTVSSTAARRHCMVVHAYYPLGETRVQREALALTDRGYEVDVVCLRGEGEPARSIHEGVVVHRLPVRRHRSARNAFAAQLVEYLLFFALAAARLTTLHLRRRYTSVQVHNLPDFLVFAAAVPKLTGTPVVLDLHDLMPEFFAARAGVSANSWLVALVRWQERLACQFADHVLTVTEGWRQTLVRRGVPPAKVSVVMNLADPRVFVRSQQPAAAAPERDGLRVMYHGTFTRRYGVDLLLDAVARVRDEVPDITLLLLGDGDARDDLVAQRARLGLEDRVEISAAMADVAGIPAAIHAADVGVVPNRSGVFTDDLLPTKLLEYVAMGTPVIASRTPTVATYFDEDMLQMFEPGNVEDLAKALRVLAEDPGRRRALADSADRFNEEHDWSSTSARYVALLDDLTLAARRAEGSQRT